MKQRLVGVPVVHANRTAGTTTLVHHHALEHPLEECADVILIMDTEDRYLEYVLDHLKLGQVVWPVRVTFLVDLHSGHWPGHRNWVLLH